MRGGNNADRQWDIEGEVGGCVLTQTASPIEPISIGGLLPGSVSESGSAHRFVSSIPPSSKAIVRPWKSGLS